MSDKKVSVSNIINNQLPSFVAEENQTFVEFLKQYYISQETEYGNISLSENIPDYKNISTYSDINTANNTILTTERVLAFDDVINVSSTSSFPEKYGLLKIDNEIITYTGKTATSFTGCARGFSGISKLGNDEDTEFLTFSETEAIAHANNSVVQNLSFIFLRELFRKYKYQFLPGFENRSLYSGISVETFLSTAKTFYSSKGTDESIKILFKVLYGKSVEVIKPFDNTIKSSDAKWISTDDMIVESISGDPLKLKFSTIFQDSLNDPSLTAIVSNVEEVFVGKKRYYRVSFERKTVERPFAISNKTRVVDKSNTETVVTVDSTIGFPESGYFNYLNSIGTYVPIYYDSKSHNQFFGCVGLTTSIDKNIPIISNKFVYGYEDNDINSVCKMRVVGSVSGLLNKESTRYFSKDDKVGLKYVGETTSSNDKRFRNWIHNNSFTVEVSTVNPSTNNIITKADHYLHREDKVEIINKNTNSIVASNAIVSQVIDSREFQISGGSLELGVEYLVRKKLSYVSSNLELDYLLADIQNTFVDNEDNAYIAFSGYPSYESLQTTDRSKTFVSNNISANTLFLADHNFINGERIYYEPLSSNSGIIGITSAIYYVKVVDADNIQFAISRESLYLNEVLEISGNGIDEHRVVPERLYSRELKNQNSIKRILKSPKKSTSYDEITGPIGVGVNGIELYSPISRDSVFYGQVEKIDVLNSGTNYDVINPPELKITDSNGSLCEANANFSGSIKEIILDNAGFDYIQKPVVTITGGNGSGAVCEAKLKAYSHSVSFSDNKVSLTGDKIDLGFDHKFLDGEEVVYTSEGLPIGIGSTNVGFQTSRLSNGGVYYISKIDDKSFSIAINKERAVSGTNLIDLLTFGNKSHQFKSTKVRKVVDTISVLEPGSNYSNKKVEINSAVYPPSSREDIFKTFVGINTVDNYIFAKNHNLIDGDILTYSTTGTSISGLSTSNYYKAKVVDKDRFKLSFAGTEDNISNTNFERKIYSDLDSIGVGTHTFKYPEIKVTVSGSVGIGTTNAPSYYTATATASVLGGVTNVFVKSGGVGYGVTDTINLIRRPRITLLTGKEGSAGVTLDENGGIKTAYIVNAGSEYTTPPVLEVVGSGKYAKLKASVSNGKLTSISIINKGVGYGDRDTFIRVIPAGDNAIFSADIYKWKLNDVSRFSSILSNENYKGTIQFPSDLKENGKKLGSFYATKEIRKILYDNLDPNTSEELDELSTHSPIIGWAYDGNPIYGPFGNAKAVPDSSGSGGLKRIESSYTLNAISDQGLRPSTYSQGYFINDYVYDRSGDLDEFNGRYIVNSDFPNGTYAYFATFDVNKTPAFPYITISHKDKSDEYNYDIIKSQSDEYLNTGSIKRDITSLGLYQNFRSYDFLSDQNSNVEININTIRKGSVNAITIDQPGEQYRVGDSITFSDESVSAEVSEILGKNIVSIASSIVNEDNLVFNVKDNVVTASKSTPISFSDGDLVEITGITSSYYKNIEGFKSIELSTVSATLSVAIGNTATTGISTFITLSEPTSTRKITKNDIVKIGDEQVLIRFVDDQNNRYFVNRIHNGTTGSAHTSGKLATKLANQFTFKIDKKPENFNTIPKKSFYFESEASVGIGTTYKTSTVGYAGSSAISKSIPPRAIYLPGHTFDHGEKLSYLSFGGTIIASNEFSLSPTFTLDSVSELYCVRLNNEFIGLSSQRSGLSTSSLYFVSSEGDSHRLESSVKEVTGSANKYVNTLTFDSDHNLQVGDSVKLDVSPQRVERHFFKYNEYIRKLVVDPVSFASTSVSVGSTESTISIYDHKYNTGDVVVYTSSDPISPLENNGVYYVIKVDNNSIRLSDTQYSATSFPQSHIGITSFGSGTHEFSLVNPSIDAYLGDTAIFSTYDASLSNYDIGFYSDKEFKSKYYSNLIVKSGIFGDEQTSTEIRVSVADSLPKKLYYRVEGINENYTDTYPSSTDTSVTNYSSINVLNSSFNKTHTISGVGSTSVTFTSSGYGETTLYESSGITSAYYTTNSSNETGGIGRVKIINSGFNLSTTPEILSIASTSGNSAKLDVQSNDIGEILDPKVIFQGVEFTTNKTLTPKASIYTILKLDNVFSLTSVGVQTGGRNYTNPPSVIAIGNSTIVMDASVRGNSVYDVDVLSSDSGLSEDLRVVPVNNSNGVTVNGASSAFEVNTLSLRAPILGYTVFPFEIGDKIYVENVKILGDGDGYNSSDYGYEYFTVSGINTISGSESVSYSIAGLGATGGTFDPTYVFARVIKEDDLAKFEPSFKKVDFFDGEVVKTIDGSAYGIVAKNGWNPELNTLKLEGVVGSFEKNAKIISELGNNKSIVANSFVFDCDLTVSSLARIEKDWESDSGKLNDNNERLHDNDYYQRFSYSVKGEVDYLTWDEPVNSLVHTSGFKGFANYEIINGIGNSVIAKTDISDVFLTADINSEASTYDRYYYDLASEDTDDPNLSKIIKFESKVLTDYNESRTNKVLLLDDISSQFNGFTTSTGGSIVGLTTFKIYSDGQEVFTKLFTSSDIDTSDSSLTIRDHDFITGEALYYEQTGGTPVGISTVVIGTGSTDILPNSVFAIKVTKDKIKLAIGKSEAESESSVEITSVGSGNTHRLSVESHLTGARALISIDNIIQSPVCRKDISVSLSTSVGSASTIVYLQDVSNIQGNSLVQIEDEIIKVRSVGIGSTNGLNVIRGSMGTVSAAHTVGAAITVLSGDYRISNGYIHFYDAPYTQSTFSGRTFYRQNYDNNYILDDISEQFDSQTSEFYLKYNGAGLSGIQTSYGAILVNNIFQKPFFGDVGSILDSDYQITGSGTTITFTGSGYEDLPRGGVINEFSVGVGSGYQVPLRAYAYAVVSAAGTIQSIGLSTSGSGYISAPRVSIADTLGIGIGASVTSSISSGLVTSFTVVNAGSGYTTSSPPLVIIDEPSPYTNIPLSGGTGSNASMNVVVGTGGSVISFDIENRGYGYSIGDVLTLTELPFQAGIGTSAFNITVDNKYQSKFSGWTFGQILELDDFSNLFNGFRKTFLLTRTIVAKEYYSIVAQEASGIDLQNNLLIFLNDILQRPGIDYEFSGGTRLAFREAPKFGSKLKIYFYVGSSTDYISVDVDETVKAGDILRLQTQGTIPSQGDRTIYELIASDTVETQTYGGVGISTDNNFQRPIVWSKQTSDTIIDGQIISKERDYLEPQIFPNTNIISSIGSTDSKIYVKNIYPMFNAIDNLGQTFNDIRIVGLGTTAITEEIEGVTYEGDYGLLVGIGTSATGISTTSPVMIFDIIPSANIIDSVSVPGISTGDYFVVENTLIGSGVTSIESSVSDVVSIGNSFIDNVYYAHHVVSVGSSTLRVYSNVDSLVGIDTNTLPSDLSNYGTYTWGAINVTRGNDSKEFEFYNQNGLLGVETSAYINRSLQLRLAY